MSGSAVSEAEVAATLALLRDELTATPPSPPTPPPLPDGPAAIRAAITDTFLPEELGADASDPSLRAILAHADLVMLGGVRRLRLNDEARGVLIATRRDTPEFQTLLRAASAEDTRVFDQLSADPVRLPGAWLRSFLVGRFGELTRAPVSELRAAVCALERLRRVECGPTVPSLDEARRLLALAELLEPLRILIGVSGGWDGTPGHDRFVGRQEELRWLRGYVDELDSESGLESLVRGVSWATAQVKGALTGRFAGVAVIAARGGLGKTALIAKFVLDHALAQTRPFPFAYLDFDRATLQPREPRYLLLEVARQVALQFPAVEPKLSELRQQVRAESVDPHAKVMTDPFGRFRILLQAELTRGNRAFLLVLDTMEVVQYDPRALQGVVDFIAALHGDGFPELRIVAAGRADIPELREATKVRGVGELRPLEPLIAKDAAAMADRLGADLLGAGWNPAWSGRITRGTKAAPERREPLSIRVAVELLCAAARESTAKAEALSRQIAERGEQAGESFIAVLYRTRILDHVRDPAVRTLAWPGLVVRRVTRQLARELLAEPCGLAPDQAETAFEGLAREVWIVERDGDSLRHQPDLRARTLPLMRVYAPPGQPRGKLFRRVNDAAIAYFGARQASNLSDRAEWLYHRLLAGESPEWLEKDWSEEIAGRLAGAEDDMEPKSPQALFLAARTARRLLAAERIRALPPRLALEHIARTASHFGEFDDVMLEPLLLWLPLEPAIEGPLSLAARAAAETLAVKTGRWRLLPPTRPEPGPWQEQALFAVRFAAARSPQRWTDLWADTSSIMSPRRMLRCLAQDLAAARLWQLGSFEAADAALTQMLRGGELRPIPQDGPALRLVVAFGEQSFAPALEGWMPLLARKLRDPRAVSISLLELGALSAASRELSHFAARLRDAVGIGEPAERVEDELPTRLGFLETQAMGLLSDLADRIEIVTREADPAALRRFAMARNEDWLLPLAYAAHRAVAGEVPSTVRERLAGHYPAARGGIARRVFRKEPAIKGDILQLLSRADEASDLAATAALFLEPARDAEVAADLRLLLGLLADWQRRIEQLNRTEPTRWESI